MTEGGSIQRHPELEDLAAFVDGRLTGADRERVVAHVADCDRCREVVAQTMRFQLEDAPGVSELEEGPAEVEAEPVAEVEAFPAAAATTQSPVRRYGWLAAAAVIVAVLAVTVSRTSWLGLAGDDTSVVALAESLSSAGASADSFDGSRWSYSRGGGGYSLGLSEPERAFRLGVRLVDLELALRTRDTEGARGLLPEVSDLGSSFDGAEHIRLFYDQLESQLESGASASELLETSRLAAESVGEIAAGGYYALGKWAEAGRVAAATGNDRVLASGAMRELRAEIGDPDLPAAASAKLGRIDRALEGLSSGVDLADLAADFAGLISEAGNL